MGVFYPQKVITNHSESKVKCFSPILPATRQRQSSAHNRQPCQHCPHAGWMATSMDTKGAHQNSPRLTTWKDTTKAQRLPKKKLQRTRLECQPLMTGLIRSKFAARKSPFQLIRLRLQAKRCACEKTQFGGRRRCFRLFSIQTSARFYLEHFL